MKFEHGGFNIMAKNNISGIQLKSTKSGSIEDVGESTRLDVQFDFSEIHVCVNWRYIAYALYDFIIFIVCFFFILYVEK